MLSYRIRRAIFFLVVSRALSRTIIQKVSRPIIYLQHTDMIRE